MTSTVSGASSSDQRRPFHPLRVARGAVDHAVQRYDGEIRHAGLGDLGQSGRRRRSDNRAPGLAVVAQHGGEVLGHAAGADVARVGEDREWPGGLWLRRRFRLDGGFGRRGAYVFPRSSGAIAPPRAVPQDAFSVLEHWMVVRHHAWRRARVRRRREPPLRGKERPAHDRARQTPAAASRASPPYVPKLAAIDFRAEAPTFLARHRGEPAAEMRPHQGKRVCGKTVAPRAHSAS